MDEENQCLRSECRVWGSVLGARVCGGGGDGGVGDKACGLAAPASVDLSSALGPPAALCHTAQGFSAMSCP